jgi:copper transport protein
VASDITHLVAATVWIGGLCLLAATSLANIDVSRAWDSIRAFSPLALGCVVVIVVTGTFQTWRDVGHLAALVHTTYGLLILAKIAGLVVLMCLGYLARETMARFFLAEPPEEPSGDTAVRVLRRLRIGVAGEVLVALVVLGLTAVLVNTATGREAYIPVAATSSTFDTGTQKGTADIVVTPATLGPQTVHLTLTDARGRPYQPVEMTVSLSLPARNVGPLDLQVLADGGGKYHTKPAPVGIAGTWTVSVTVRSDPFNEATIPVQVPIQ